MQPNLLIRGKTPDPSYTYADDSSVQLLDDSLLEQHDKEYSDEPILGNRKWVSPTLVLLAAILFFVCSIVLLVISATYRSTDQECVARLNVYSPLVEAVEYEEVDFANAFTQKSPFRGPPNAELEEAWDKLWKFGGVNIPEEQFRNLNRSSEKTYQRVDEEKGGGFAGMIEGFHQLHCLNLIRQYTWLDHYDSPPDGLEGSDEKRRTHVDHCIETLRLSLMCNFDVTTYAVELDAKAPMGHKADFDSHHKCMKWDKLVSWMGENEALS